MAHPTERPSEVVSPRMDSTVMSSGLKLSAHLAVPEGGAAGAPGLVLCHGFPVRGREAPASGKSFPELADRIANEMGWVVLTINFRGCGTAQGDFSMRGWLDDISAAAEHLAGLRVRGVWLGGFGSGGALCICEAARNPAIVGVAAMGTPADFADWARNPRRLLTHARAVGVVRHAEFPTDFEAWAAELRDISSLHSVGAVAPRSLLLMHGETDELVPSIDARLLADAHGDAELRIIAGAGHELRHDPRAVSVFLGWLGRQQHGESAEPDGRLEPDPELDDDVGYHSVVSESVLEEVGVVDGLVDDSVQDALDDLALDAVAAADPEDQAG